MKALPKLMKNSVLAIQIVSEEMPEFSISIVEATSWPNIARLDPATKTLRFFDNEGIQIHEISAYTANLPRFSQFLPNFGLAFIGVTESSVDFQTKSQRLVAKMRAINLDSHEALHGDNWGYDE